MFSVPAIVGGDTSEKVREMSGSEKVSNTIANKFQNKPSKALP